MRPHLEDANVVPSADAARRIDAVCDRFEQQLQNGEAPRFSFYLAQFEEELQPVLLRQLLLLQWDYDGRRHDSIDLQTYLDLFPSHSLLIQNTAVEHLTDLKQREHRFREAADKQQAAARITRQWEDSAYQILRRLGGGAMGSVWLAEERATKQLVAIKILRHDSQCEPRGIHRFRNEVQALQKLEHPNIVQILDFDVHVDEPFYTMEYCPGGSLADALRTQRLTPEESAKLIKTLADAVHVAHQAGVVHRDLKPSNILLQTAELPDAENESEGFDATGLDTIDECPRLTERYIPKLADFGLSKDKQAASISQTAAIIGSPPYMAPEQIEDSKSAGSAVDVHALGTVLYECLTGEPPFQGANPLLTIQQVVSRNAQSPTQREPNVPNDLSAICIRCLEKNPAERYSTAKELAGDLERFLNGQPVYARRKSVGRPLLGWVQEYPLLLTLLLALVIASCFAADYQQRFATGPSAENALLAKESLQEIRKQEPGESDFAVGFETLPEADDAALDAAIQKWHSSEQFTFRGQASATASGKSTILSDQRIIVDTSKQYELSVYARARGVDGKQLAPDSLHYIGIVCYDVDGHEIRPWNFMKNPEAVDTTLARDLNPGDRTIYLTDASGWYDGPNGFLRTFAWYGYENSRGDVYPDYTYTRNTSLDCWDQDAIDENMIELKVRWNGPALSAGEPVRNAWNSYQHNYRFLAPGHVTEEEQYLHAPIGGENQSGKINLSKFRPGTHSIAAFAITDHTNTGTQLTLRGFTLTLLPRSDKNLAGFAKTNK
jgi:serine/threonine protein kinase